MYVNFLGGSALLHILAAHPKVVATLGIAATIATLCAPLAPRSVGAIAGHAEVLELAVGPAAAASDARVEELRQTFHVDEAAVRGAVIRALDACGAPCHDLSLSLVLDDLALLEKALFIAALDREADARGLPNKAEIARRLVQR
jgi:hypothetical protein